MNQLQSFNHPVFGELPIILIENKEYFGATEAAKALGYKDPYDALKKHTLDKGSVIRPVLTNSGTQNKKFINEGNLYRLITRSKLPSAEKFETWVFDEVLPSIRKHGAFMTPQTIEKAITSPDFLIQLATNLKQEQEARKLAETKLVQQQPLVSFAQTCMASEKALLVREVAKLATKQGIVIGERRLYQKLREWKLIFANKNEPYQEYLDRGYFEISQGVKENARGTHAWLTMRITPKGQGYIFDRLRKEKLVS